MAPVHAKGLHWPEAKTSIAWQRSHECREACHNLIRAVDRNCYAAEIDRDLSADGIARRRAEIGRQRSPSWQASGTRSTLSMCGMFCC
jgi:hypothetical protein